MYVPDTGSEPGKRPVEPPTIAAKPAASKSGQVPVFPVVYVLVGISVYQNTIVNLISTQWRNILNLYS